MCTGVLRWMCALGVEVDVCAGGVEGMVRWGVEGMCALGC